ncbi:M23 family metallopeptidase [Phenylobacterium sp.]|uniref:M23 family metallopeptidase n=1 Tax=Phenylobacterium sp. TaxID=1871053 RepID=UPI0035B4D7E2
MTEASSALEARARHWIVDAAVGAVVALGAITMAHAALPERTAPAVEPRAEPAVRLIPAAVQPSAPVDLISFQHPVLGEAIVSPFGLRQLPWEENGRLHEGVDIAADFGEPVLASADGVVTRAGQSYSYGRFVEIEHAEGLTTLYAHMGGVAAEMRPGLAVKAGTPVGRVGSSGTSTGPHLHFEIRDSKDRPLNPALFVGKSFATAEDLPLRDARRFPRRVRMAYVSRIPESKKVLMEAKLAAKDGRAAPAAPAKDSGVTIFYGDGRPKATIRVGTSRQPVAATGVEADTSAIVRPVPVPAPAPAPNAPVETVATANG